MLKANDPRRNLISHWNWGGRVEFYEFKDCPRWIKCRGLLRDPCDVAGCQAFVLKGEWYVRHPFLGVVCQRCAATFGAMRS